MLVRRYAGTVGRMNHTKWKEIFRAFYHEELNLCGKSIPYRTLATNGYLSPWDTSWTHFGSEAANFKDNDRLEIRLTDENREYVLEQLHKIHVPGAVQGDTVTVFGCPQAADYL